MFKLAAILLSNIPSHVTSSKDKTFCKEILRLGIEIKEYQISYNIKEADSDSAGNNDPP